MESIRKVNPKAVGVIDEPSFIAEVVAVNNGLVSQVFFNGLNISVDHCVTGLMAARKGERVIVQRMGRVVVVTHRIANESEPAPPSMRFDGGRWCLQSSEALELRIGKAELSIEPNGDVTVSGADILTDASGVNRILGSRIELN